MSADLQMCSNSDDINDLIHNDNLQFQASLDRDRDFNAHPHLAPRQHSNVRLLTQDASNNSDNRFEEIFSDVYKFQVGCLKPSTD